jgi:hypothetical protein
MRQQSKKDFIFLLASKLDSPIYDITAQYPNEPFTTRLTSGLAQDALLDRVSEEDKQKLSQLCDLIDFKDARTPYEYGLDLIFGWIVEDILIRYLKENGLVVIQNGIDLDREFLTAPKITTDADITINGKHYDIYYDSKGTWQTENSMDVRESKWNKLKTQNGAILCISDSGFAIVETKNENPGVWENYRWGFKRAVSINGMKERLLPNAEQFVKLLKDNLN